MITFYDGIIWILFSCCTSIITLFGIAAFLGRGKYQSLTQSPIFIYGVLIISFIIASVLFISVGRRLQEAIAEPYIQQALDQKCGQGIFHTSEGEFYNESGYYWRLTTNSAQCYNSNEGWICSCSTK